MSGADVREIFHECAHQNCDAPGQYRVTTSNGLSEWLCDRHVHEGRE